MNFATAESGKEDSKLDVLSRSSNLAVRVHRGITDIILGRPLASSEAQEQKLTVFTGLPVLGLDALASTGYGPEAALTVLVPLGEVGLRRFPFVEIGRAHV